MTKIKKIKNIFHNNNIEFEDIEKISKNLYLRNLNIVFFLSLLVYFIVSLINNQILCFFYCLSIALLYTLLLFLYKKKKIKQEFFKVSVFLLFAFLVLSYLTFSNVFLFHLLFIPLLSFFIFSEVKIWLLPIIIIVFFEGFYFTGILYKDFVLKNVIIISSAYIVCSFVFYFLYKRGFSKLSMLKNITGKEVIRLQLEKKLMNFALHQVRSAVTNLTVYEELISLPNIDKNELRKYKKLSLEAFCASISVFEDISMKNKADKKNCNFRNVVKKIVTFFETEYENMSFKNYKTVNITLENFYNQLLFVKTLFLLLELIRKTVNKKEISINLENIKEENKIKFRLTLDNYDISDIFESSKGKIYFQIINELLDSFQSELKYADKNKFDFIFPQDKIKDKYFDYSGKELVEKYITEEKYKVLLAEDDEINQKIYTLGFEKYFGKIDIASNGEDVMRSLKTGNYDLLVMDLQMPKLTGIEVIKQIRDWEKKTLKNLVVIGITANSLIYNEKDIMSFGFDDFFIKPFKIKNIYNSFLKIIKNKNYG